MLLHRPEAAVIEPLEAAIGQEAPSPLPEALAPPGRRIDLNCDMGEGFGAYRMGADVALMPLISSANIACGFHAGDPLVMEATVALATRHGVAVGAHPGFYDLRGFGRRAIIASASEVEADVLYQIGALVAFATAHGAPLVHVKPHGALYNQAAIDPVLAKAIARGVARFSNRLILVGLAGSEPMQQAADAEGLRFAPEAFADRTYNPDSTLQSRRFEGSLITDPAKAAAQAVRIARDGLVIAHDGTRVPVAAETICVHGDNPRAVEIVRAVREALIEGGLQVASFNA